MKPTTEDRIGKYFNPWRRYHGIFIPEQLLSFTGISPAAKLCYGRLTRYAGKEGKCFPRQDTLASEIGVSERMIREYLRELEIGGFIETLRVGLGHPNQYRFLKHKVFEDEQLEDESLNGSFLPVKSGEVFPVKSGEPFPLPYKEEESQLRESSEESPPPIVPLEDLILEISRMRAKARHGRRLKTDERELLSAWLRKECPEHAVEAFGEFLADPCWHEKKFPIYGFISQFNRYVSQLSHNGNGAAPASQPEAAEPRGVVQILSDPSTPLAGYDSVNSGLPLAAAEWNRVVTSGEPVSDWTTRDAHLLPAMRDPAFISELPKVLKRCQEAREAQEEFTRHVTFRWLLRKNKSTQVENWYGVSTGDLAWATSKKGIRAKKKTAGEIASEEYAASQGWNTSS